MRVLFEYKSKEKDTGKYINSCMLEEMECIYLEENSIIMKSMDGGFYVSERDDVSIYEYNIIAAELLKDGSYNFIDKYFTFILDQDDDGEDEDINEEE